MIRTPISWTVVCVLSTLQGCFPVVGSLVAGAWMYASDRRNVAFPVLVGVACALSLLNSTKVPENDLATYLLYYQDMRGITFSGFIDRYGNEPVFYFISLVVGSVSNFSEYAFQYLVSFCFYVLLLFGLYHLLAHFDDDRKLSALLFAIVIAANPVVFSNSLHLIRQFGALALLLLATTREGAPRALFLGLALFTHASVLPLVIFAIQGKGAALLKVISVSALVTLPTASSLISSSFFASGYGVFSYFAQRASQHQFYALDDLTLAHYLFIILTYLTVVFVRIVKSDWRRPMVSIQLESLLIITGTIVLLCGLVFKFSEPAGRYMFFFIPIALVYLAGILIVSIKQSAMMGAMGVAFSILMLSRLYQGSGGWTYGSLDPAVLLSTLFLVM